MVSRGSVRRAPTSRVLLCAAVACALVPVLAAGEHDEANPHPREAYVTLVTSPEYVVGAEVLARCLRHFGTQRRMVALVGSTLQDAQVGRLSAAGFETTRVPDIKTLPVRALLDRPGFNATMNKLHVFGLFKDFDQVVFLDADVLVLANLDHLFSRDLSRGPPFAAAPEMMPPDRFNSGVMVVRPSQEAYDKVLKVAARISSPDGSDQGLLNEAFPEWFASGPAHRLPFHYNVLQTVASYYIPAWDRLRDSLKVLHFAGDLQTKPWSFSGSLPPSLGVYLYLWQSIARAEKGADISQLFSVLSITDPAQVSALFNTPPP